MHSQQFLIDIIHKGANLLAKPVLKIHVLSASQAPRGGKKINKSKSLFIFQQEKEGMFTVSTFTAEKTGVSTSCSLVYPFPILTTNPRKHSLLAVSTLPELDPGSNPHLVQRDNTWFPQLQGTWLNLLRTRHTTHAHGSFISEARTTPAPFKDVQPSIS